MNKLDTLTFTQPVEEYVFLWSFPYFSSGFSWCEWFKTAYKWDLILRYVEQPPYIASAASKLFSLDWVVQDSNYSVMFIIQKRIELFWYRSLLDILNIYVFYR